MNGSIWQNCSHTRKEAAPMRDDPSGSYLVTRAQPANALMVMTRRVWRLLRLTSALVEVA